MHTVYISLSIDISPNDTRIQDETLFPKQLIHGDLHYDNVLVEADKVSGLLDFEFCAYDWRAMELAVIDC